MNRYQDYVFKDGRFVGEFDKMYREATETPWHQDETANMIFSDIDIGILNHFPFQNFCEVGCGLGYFTKRVQNEMRFNGPYSVLGLDISEDAIQKARELHQNVKFDSCNVLNLDECNQIVQSNGKFDMILVKKVVWYVIEEFDIFYNNMMGMLARDGYLLISQSFPETKSYFGVERFPDTDAMVKSFSKDLTFCYQCIEADTKSNGRELVHYLGQKVCD